MTIGAQLRRAREARSLSLEQAAQATHIRAHYLKALEADQFESLPSTAQVRGFLRSYAGYLKIESEPLLAALDGAPLPPPAQAAQAAATAAEGQPEAGRLSEDDAALAASGKGAQAAGGKAAQAAPTGQAEAIFIEIGQKLRGQRETLGLSIEDVERHTHIRSHYVLALEAGNLGGLPSPVQGRGMLNNYARFLGLETDPLLLRFADGLQTRLAEKKSAQPAPARSARKTPGRPSLLRRLFSVDFLLGGVFIIFLVLFTAWATLRISDLRSTGEPTPTAPSVADVLAPSPTATASPTAATPQPTDPGGATPATTAENGELPPPATPGAGTEALEGSPTAAAALSPTPDFGTSPVQVYIIIQQRAWMRVTVDGEVQFEGRVMPGSAYPFAGSERVELVTGNGAGLQVFFNQQDLGLLGVFGEVVERVFTVQGILTATPAVSPTPLPSDTPTPTVEGAATPTPTPTPTLNP